MVSRKRKHGIFAVPEEAGTLAYINDKKRDALTTDGNTKYVDHLIKGIFLIEMKSRSKNLDKVKSQTLYIE